MPGLKLKTPIPAASVQKRASAIETPAHVERSSAPRKISSVLPGTLVKRDAGPQEDIQKSTKFLVKELSDMRSDISEMHSAIVRIGDRVTQDVASSCAQLHAKVGERLAQAMQKRDIAFDIKRDSDGRIQSVVARPAS